MILDDPRKADWQTFSEGHFLDCPTKCSGQVIVEDLVCAACNRCDQAFSTAELVRMFDTSQGVFYCLKCNDSDETVVPFPTGYVCVGCLATYEKVGQSYARLD